MIDITEAPMTTQLTLPLFVAVEGETQQCLWCGKAVPYGHICLHETNISFAYTSEPPVGQCAWCGLILSGPHAGKYAMTHSSYDALVPDLSIGQSHGICLDCASSLSKRHKKGIDS